MKEITTVGIDLAKSAFTVCGISETGADVFFSEFRIVAEDLLMRHSGREPAEYVSNRDPHPTYTWSAAALAGFDSDDV